MEILHQLGDLAGFLDTNDTLRIRNLQVDGLSGWWIGRVNNGESCACFQNTHNCNHKVDSSISVDHHNVASLNSCLDKVVTDNVGGLINLFVRENTILCTLLQERGSLNHTGSVWMLVCIIAEDVLNGTAEITPVEIYGGVCFPFESWTNTAMSLTDPAIDDDSCSVALLCWKESLNNGGGASNFLDFWRLSAISVKGTRLSDPLEYVSETSFENEANELFGSISTLTTKASPDSVFVATTISSSPVSL
ncbi:hypothetical protein OGAPHI_004958 [Ogataea philodendri]|uniref:Uncharacterized protein n=1 Tax=Ogataea philodendri TaxID=1378263 RepID=A0A9P8P1L9_9ASCO|nr:uncharacterized protein OGAPHI_004958 [Ogataea philodendri]KAH3663557.1 hypothetical protein OGAPHI_004958 [Ogataea philodendri]